MDWDWWEETGWSTVHGITKSQTGLTHDMSQQGVGQNDVSAQRLLKKKKTAAFTKSGSHLNKTTSEYEYFSHGIIESLFIYHSI